jgi:3-oxoacyl-[acyl-carrier protein] reductase
LIVDGAVALVTGGAQGLGLAIALRLAAEGASVVVADRDADALATLPQGLEGVLMDATDAGQVKETVLKILQAHGRIDILVNNAGVIASEPFVNLLNASDMMHDYGRFDDTIRSNLNSVFIVSAAVVEQMITSKTKGTIVNISSISASGNKGQTAYSAAKAGVNAMTVTWSKELGPWGIRSNAIAPGFIDTVSTRKALDTTNLKSIVDMIPIRRLGEAEEVAHAVLLIIQNDFINGSVLEVSGGLTI